jgi:hypothetical protein
VISVTMIHAGEATNVVPDSCEIQGTVRTFTLEVLDLIERRMKVVAESTCAAFEAECEFEFTRNYPPTINHPAETEFARKVLSEMVGAENVHEFEPTMGSEDFSYFLLEKARLLLPDRQRRRHAPRRRPRPGPLHAAQPQLRLQRRADPARRLALGAPGRSLAGEMMPPRLRPAPRRCPPRGAAELGSGPALGRPVSNHDVHFAVLLAELSEARDKFFAAAGCVGSGSRPTSIR